MKKKITILGIESSCDETAVSIIEENNDKTKILSNIVSSQVDVHKEFGGVYQNWQQDLISKKLI